MKPNNDIRIKVLLLPLSVMPLFLFSLIPIRNLTLIKLAYEGGGKKDESQGTLEINQEIRKLDLCPKEQP